MNYGLYLSASGVLTNMYRQDVFANNLANVQTTSFKPDVATVRQRDPEAIEAGFFQHRHRLLDRLGGGASSGPQHIDFSPGSLTPTGRPLDIALPTSNQFLAVQHTDPTTGQQGFRLTRDGRLMLNSAGQLVTSAGHKLLDAENQPIALDPLQPVRISSDGTIYQGEDAAAQLQITGVSDLKRLVKAGGNLFRIAGDVDQRTPAADPTVHVGFIEQSAADPIKTLMNLTAAAKAVSSNANMIRYHDSIMDRAVNVLGRVA